VPEGGRPRDRPDPIVAWDAALAGSLLALGVQGLEDYRVPIAWFEKRLADVPVPPPIYRPYYFPNALGALLIRAGRIDEAITRLNEGTAAAKEAKFQDYPTDWAYLALAHARKGNLAEARRWLEHLRTLRPASSITFWDLQELALLRSEAESLLFDAEFPGDPFVEACTISGEGS
jgi:tetratricopeptide (TPR) repeat protein